MNGLQGQTASAARERGTPLEGIYERVCSHNTRLSEMCGVLTTAMDKMVGPVPPKDSEEAPEPEANTSISKINAELNRQNTLIYRLAEQAQRVAELG